MTAVQCFDSIHKNVTAFELKFSYFSISKKLNHSPEVVRTYRKLPKYGLNTFLTIKNRDNMLTCV